MNMQSQSGGWLRGMWVAAACFGMLVPAIASAQSSSSSAKVDQKDSQKSSTAKTVKLGDLEEHGAQYVNQKITVAGEVANVLGPRLFTIDEPNWIDLDGETVVLVPAPFAAMVRRDAPVTVTGTVRPFVKADIERESEWSGSRAEFDVDISKKFVLVADDVTTLGAHALLELSTGTAKPVATSGTSGSDKSAPLSDVSVLAKSNDNEFVGKRVDLKNAHVTGTTDRGFWIAPNAGSDRVLVMPSDGEHTKVAQGQNVTVTGVVLEMPKALKQKIGDAAKSEHIYVYANSLSIAR